MRLMGVGDMEERWQAGVSRALAHLRNGKQCLASSGAIAAEADIVKKQKMRSQKKK